MIRVQHRFSDHQINPETETLIIGTFNPETPKNDAEIFYGRKRNYLWKLLPIAFGERDLKGTPHLRKFEFIRNYKIDLIDLIEELEVEEGEEANYDDAYIDSRVTRWRDVIGVIDTLPNLKRVCLTRKTFSGIPNMKKKVEAIQEHCDIKGIPFKALTTPSRFYSADKQTEWTNFFSNGNE